MPESTSRQPDFFPAKLTSSPYEALTQSLDGIAQDTTMASALGVEEIVRTVMETVRRATSEIKMTMDLAEEISQPLPVSYHQLLSTKLDGGVQITRVGFGTKKDFQEVAQSHSFNSPNFKFAHNPNLQEYQRMILVDGNALFFRHNDVFYSTTEANLIEQFQNYFSRTVQRSLEESSPERKPNPLPEKLKDYGGSFGFRGKFPDGIRIQHNTPYGAWMTGEPDLFLTVHDEDIKGIEQSYNDEIRRLESEFELYTKNNQGLSKEQNLRIHAAYIAISDFNGKPIHQSSTELFSTPYRRSQTDTLRIKDFKGKGEIACLEASAIIQQLLSKTDDVLFISGFMDSSRVGKKDVLQMGVQPHAFNLIKPSNNSEYPVYLLDIANPHIYPTADGKDFTWEPYCIPLSEQQLSMLRQGSDLILAEANGTRTYSARNGAFDS